MAMKVGNLEIGQIIANTANAASVWFGSVLVWSGIRRLATPVCRLTSDASGYAYRIIEVDQVMFATRYNFYQNGTKVGHINKDGSWESVTE